MGAAVKLWPADKPRLKRIDALTPEQAAMMPAWQNRWIEIGLRTWPADRDAFERHVRDCYRLSGLAEPKAIIWVPSPAAVAVAAPIAAVVIEWVKTMRTDEGFRRWFLANAFSPSGSGKSPAGVRAGVRAGVDAGVSAGVDASVSAGVDAGVDGIDPRLAKALCDAVQQGWTAGLSLGEKLDAWARAYIGTVESACWWWPHRDFVMVSERPCWIDRDERGRLHSTKRKAIQWPDGWGLYRVSGVDVPADIIERPETLTAARIDSEANAEVRRVMVDMLGYERFLKDSGAKLLDEDTDSAGQPRRLWQKRWPDGRSVLSLEVHNSTPEPDGSRRRFFLGIHAECRPMARQENGTIALGEPQKLTAQNAVGSTFGKRGEDYMPRLET